MTNQPSGHSQYRTHFDDFRFASSDQLPADVVASVLNSRGVTHARRMQKVRFFAVLLTSVCSACGCVRQPAPVSSVELSLEQQISAVQAGRSDRIVCEQVPLDSNTEAGRVRLEALAGLPTLRVLQLDHIGNHLSPAEAARLFSLPKLEHIRLRGVPVDDAAISGIPATSELRIVNLPNADLTDAGFAALRRLPKLEQLRLGSPRVTGAGLQSLKTFPSLLRLHLIDVPVTDAGLRVFHELPQLQSLYLDGAVLSDAAYDELFAARPDLHVHLNQRHHDRDPRKHVHAEGTKS